MTVPVSVPAALPLPMLVIDTAQHSRASGSAQVSAPVGAQSAATPAAPVSGVALVLADRRAAGGYRIETESYAAGLTRGGDLIDCLDRLARRCGLEPGALAAVGVNLGPGSWTGLRIGLTAAKSLVATAGCPLIAIDGLCISALAFACAHPEPATAVLVQDSGHGKLYAARYRLAGGVWPQEQQPPALVEIPSLSETFAAGPGILLGVERLPEKTRRAWTAAFPQWPAGWTPADRPVSLVATALGCVTAAGQNRFIHTADRIHALAPLYLKDPYSP